MVGHSYPSDAVLKERSRSWWQRRWVQALLVLAIVGCAGLFLVGEYVLHHAEPILRKRILETLSARFNAPVDLDRLEISLLKGVQVDGYGLTIPFGAKVEEAPMTSLFTVQHFRFRTSFRALFHQPMHVATVRVEGMELHIPPPSMRERMERLRAKQTIDETLGLPPKVAIIVDEVQCIDVRLYLEPEQGGKDPLLFRISHLELQGVSRNQPMSYDAQLTNPKPYGLIHAQGHFGPWAGQSALPSRQRDTPLPDPGKTPIDGQYTFAHADLGTLHGLRGTLSSAGRFSGVLDRLSLEGTADVPDFSLDISNHPMPLRTSFHAIVDGTNGDTYLQPVHARLGASDFMTWGKVVKLKGQGHDIQLSIDVPHGRMQDFLRLAVKTEPPVMDGTLGMAATMHIPPGRAPVPLKMDMAGSFHMSGVRFNNPRWQDQLDGLSARAQGHPGNADTVSHDRDAEVHSALAAHFVMAHGVMTVSGVQYTLPGATVLLNGVYGMDGKLFEFKGHVRTVATASEMLTGWKSLLLKPVDHFFEKNGAGLELPVEISGTQGDLHLGLALHGADDTPQQILAELRAKDHAQQELAEARRLSAQADGEDQAAARAATVQRAKEAHKAAVRDRAAAASLLDAIKAKEDPRSSPGRRNP